MSKKDEEIELTVEEQNFLPIFLDLVSENDIVFAHINDGSKEDLAINGILKKLENAYKGLQHHKDTTVGLYATDRPDLIHDPKKVMFRIKGLTNT